MQHPVFRFRSLSLGLAIPVLLSCFSPAARPEPVQSAPVHTLRAAQGHFELDGKPFQIISGEMHYPRVPRAEWRARLRMARAMGLNAITTYVFWNEHEQEPGVYDFTGQRDLAEFIREAGEEGLYVILRPGPYVCAEWEWGGYPAWLLKEHGIVVRSADPRFMEPARRWLLRLGRELAPLQAANGGPILAVQVENEYGSFGSDHAYMEQIRKTLIDAGFGRSLLYTADGPEQVPAGSLPDLPAVINFGTGDAKGGFAQLQKLRPAGPFMTGEYWAGWFDHWGEKHHTTGAQQQADELAWMLQQGYSVSIYMFHGGTSFGWMNGANWDHGAYQPDTTSYDYDAPLDESGRPTAKFKLFRDVITKATGTAPPAIPATPAPVAVASFKLQDAVSLWNTLPKPVASSEPLSMEDIGQAYGYILYRTEVAGPVHGELVLDQLHDYARVYADGVQIGSLDRRLGQSHLAVDLPHAHTQLDILVENSGRINFSTELRGERKGITHQVTLNGTPLTGWQIFPLPMKSPQTLAYSTAACTGACFARGSFRVDAPGDTFLDTSNFSKGFVWVNGHALGRVWNIGPQQALYLPGAWLKAGENEVIIFDLDSAPGRTLSGRTAPVFGNPPEHK
jgi:beta-galactosidase